MGAVRRIGAGLTATFLFGTPLAYLPNRLWRVRDQLSSPRAVADKSVVKI
jgi:hypothetical protein